MGEDIANDLTDEELVSEIYKELIEPNTRNTNNPSKKWLEDTNRRFSRKNTDG